MPVLHLERKKSMVKTEHQLQSMSWDTHHHHQPQQQLDYYMNVPATSYTNVNLIINNTTNTNRINCNGTSQTSNRSEKSVQVPTGTTAQTVPTSTPKSRSTSGKNSSSPSSEFGSTSRYLNIKKSIPG